MEKRGAADQVVAPVLKRIGVLGGTFDPVHLGHINLALDAMHEMKLDRVFFIPAKLQPFKLDKEVTSGEDRLAMIEAAISGIDGLESSTLELDAENISYTYLTIRALREKYGRNCRIYFITGTDAFLKIETWKNADELLSSCSYLVGTRPGYRQKELEECMSRIRERYGTEIRNLHNSRFDISSTEIRERLRADIPCADLIPESVERYIKENGLYKT